MNKLLCIGWQGNTHITINSNSCLTRYLLRWKTVFIVTKYSQDVLLIEGRDKIYDLLTSCMIELVVKDNKVIILGLLDRNLAEEIAVCFIHH